MRVAIAVLIVAAAGFVAPAKAADSKWCAIWSDGARNCAYTSMERCQQATAGAGGKCVADTTEARPAKAVTAPDDELDKLIDRVNKKANSLILCRGC